MCPRGTNIGASVTCSVCQVPAVTLIAAQPASSSHLRDLHALVEREAALDAVVAVDAPHQRQADVDDRARDLRG